MPSPFLESVRSEIRLRGYSLATEKSYLLWIRRFIHYVDKRHPSEVGAEEVKAFLSWLATSQHVAVNTQKVALNALVFLYQKVLRRELGELGFSLATKQRALPTVLAASEVAQILQQLEEPHRTVVELMYGSGLRVSEALRLRVQDVDLNRLALSIGVCVGIRSREYCVAIICIPLQSARQSEAAVEKQGLCWR